MFGETIDKDNGLGPLTQTLQMLLQITDYIASCLLLGNHSICTSLHTINLTSMSNLVDNVVSDDTFPNNNERIIENIISLALFEKVYNLVPELQEVDSIVLTVLLT